MDNQQRYIEIEGQQIPVTEEVYRAYMRLARADHKRHECEKRYRDENGNRITNDRFLGENHDDQNQSNERRIYLKDLHQWVPVSKTDYDNYYRDINAYRRRQQEHGRCVCPASKRYLCDMDCWTCRFRKAGDELSLDYTITDDDGNVKSWLDDLADEDPSVLSIIEERELLDALMSKIGELDPDGRRICELLLQDKSEREIAAIMGFSRQSTVNYKKHKAFETLREHLRDYI